jgi:hypothetical protein
VEENKTSTTVLSLTVTWTSIDSTVSSFNHNHHKLN